MGLLLMAAIAAVAYFGGKVLADWILSLCSST